jgi:hypothetical protein
MQPEGALQASLQALAAPGAVAIPSTQQVLEAAAVVVQQQHQLLQQDANS